MLFRSQLPPPLPAAPALPPMLSSVFICNGQKFQKSDIEMLPACISQWRYPIQNSGTRNRNRSCYFRQMNVSSFKLETRKESSLFLSSKIVENNFHVSADLKMVTKANGKANTQVLAIQFNLFLRKLS